MRSLVHWAIHNPPAVNVVMLLLLGMGAYCLASLRREFWPYHELDIVEVRVIYPGASPDEIEEAICAKIEEVVRSIRGVEEVRSTASEGAALVQLELDSKVDKVDIQRIIAEVRAEVDQIPSFPELAEEPDIRQVVPRSTAILVGVMGPDDESVEARLQLRQIAEQVRDDLLLLPSISQVEILGAPQFEIDVEISEETLRQYNLSLSQVADTIRGEHLDLPAGTLKSNSQEILLRGSNKTTIGREIAKLPLLTQADGMVLTVGDLGVVRDEFTDEAAISRLNGRPGLALSIEYTTTEDLLAIGWDVYDYVDTKRLPPGYSLVAYADRTDDVRDRLKLMTKNGLQGLVLVFLLLALFLEMRLAMWVALGIPISLLGACIVMYFAGQTLNLTSLFAFMIALGIVVDDAIVVGENIYVHRGLGKTRIQAAIDGAVEVLPSVSTSVITTVIAFLPMLFVTGSLGRFTTVLPLAVISMLLVSLGECITMLPCHLAHGDGPVLTVLMWLLTPLRFVAILFAWLNRRVQQTLDAFIDRLYLPCLRCSLKNPPIVISAAVGLLLLAAGVVWSGRVPFIILPQTDSNVIMALIAYPDGTPVQVTDRATQRLETAMAKINQETIDRRLTERAEGVLLAMHRTVGYGTRTSGDVSTGSHVGSVTVSMIDSGMRKIRSQDIVNRWRELAGEFPGADTIMFTNGPRGPAAAPIEFSLLARSEDLDELETAVTRCTERLSGYPGVYDISAGSRPGKYEYRLKIKDGARAMGVSLADLTQTVRAAYYGEEVTRLQRGRHEVELRVRYPRDQRRSLADFREIRVRTGDGSERPLTELAEVEVARTYAMIHRTDQMRSITIEAEVDEDAANAFNIVNDMQSRFMPALLDEFPSIQVRWEGQREQTSESMHGMVVGFSLVLVGMFLLLTIEFKSYAQPLIVLSIIPFGFIGAMIGHLLMGLPLTLFSIYGLVALSGVVVNDSIVLIDFINRRIQEGSSLEQALQAAGCRRFRPVLLTSVTTIAGMLPILLETQRQALVLIPMATSLAFGLMTSTVLVVILAPTFYLASVRLANFFVIASDTNTSLGEEGRPVGISVGK